MNLNAAFYMLPAVLDASWRYLDPPQAEIEIVGDVSCLAPAKEQAAKPVVQAGRDRQAQLRMAY